MRAQGHVSVVMRKWLHQTLRPRPGPAPPLKLRRRPAFPADHMDPAYLLQRAISRSKHLGPIQKTAVLNAACIFNTVFTVEDRRLFAKVIEDIKTMGARCTHSQLAFITLSYLNNRLQFVPKGNLCQWVLFKNHRWYRLRSVNVLWFLVIGMCCILEDLAMPSPQSLVCVVNTSLFASVANEMSNILSVVHPDGVATLMDAKHHLIGFENGVYDLTLKLFRTGRPEDYLTRSTGYLYTKHHPEIEAVKSFLKSLFVVHGLYDYFVKVVARSLHGKPIGRPIVLFGPESNGKSSLARLLLYAGGFCGYATLCRQSRDARHTQHEYMDIQEGRCAETSRFNIFDENHPSSLPYNDESNLDETLIFHPTTRQIFRAYDQRTTFVMCTSVVAATKHCLCIPMPAQFSRSPCGDFVYAEDTTIIDKVKTWGPAAMSLFLQIWEETPMNELDNIIYSPPEWVRQLSLQAYLKDCGR